MVEVLEIIPFGGPIDAVAVPPGSKSITNRALVLAALIEGENRDSQALFAALDYHRHDVVYVSKRTRPEA